MIDLRLGRSNEKYIHMPKTLLNRSALEDGRKSEPSSFLKRTRVERKIERGLATVGERVVSYWPGVQCGRALPRLFLQLVSRLPHHEAVQALQVPAAVVLVALLPRPEHDQGGVTSDLEEQEQRVIACALSLGLSDWTNILSR